MRETTANRGLPTAPEPRPEHWRSLDELRHPDAAREASGGEFPPGADERPDALTRRAFVQLLGASAALAGVGACTQPAERILPYVRQPPELTPGIPLHYATSMELDGFATGLVVESHAGRPTKVEGNPAHPASLGAAGVFEQASVLQLYDPHRAKAIRARNAPATWRAFLEALLPGAPGARRGAGFSLLVEPTSSPLVADLVGRIREVYPEARVYFYSPLASPPGLRSGAGRALLPQHDVRAADVMLALDADFLGAMPFHLRYARHFAERRRITAPAGEMNRLYVAEGTPSVTGSMADHRLRVRTSDVQRLLAAVLAEVTLGHGARAPGMPEAVAALLAPLREGGAVPRDWVRAVARDLRASAGRSIVITGARQSPVMHAMTHLLNAALGNVGRTVWYTESPIIGAGEPTDSLAALIEQMRAGAVSMLMILGGNPSYAAPAELEFARWLRAVPTTIYLGPYDNETARDCTWLIPAAHYLESWGDARAYDGTLSLVQPLIVPLYGGKTTAEVLAAVLGEGERSAYEMLRARWRGGTGGTDAETSWAEALRLGVVPDTAAPRADVALPWPTLPLLLEQLARTAQDVGAVEVVFQQDPSVYDGRFANNAWLQEFPDPITKLTWDNAALVSPATAERLGLETGDMVRLGLAGGSLRIPAFVLPGHADDSISLRFGYGHHAIEGAARAAGFDVYRIWPSSMPYFAPGVAVERVLEGDAPVRYALATTQTHWTMEGRPIVRRATLEEYRRNPDFTRAQRGRVLSLYEPYEYQTGDQWAMAIDLSLCTGCGACVLACQAENNVPTVGKEGVLKSREMHWLRVDRYYVGDPADPEVVPQPMLCQHCEKAPCEYVCPVNATVHSVDGLNEMVYNRCVGTRFCSNNCPYKVRRFNWFDYNAEIAETEAMVMNPDVTVRERGVMEKCTFCVQRIRQTQIAARLDGRPVRDGEVQTACQQACPTRAIVFGSLTDPDSDLVRRLAERRRYAVLHDLGTQPRVQYLARITNPNPELGAAASGG